MVDKKVGPARFITANNISVAIAVGPMPNQIVEPSMRVETSVLLVGTTNSQIGKTIIVAEINTPEVLMNGFSFGKRRTRMVFTA